MDKRLHLLESFPAEGSDGRHDVVHGYEHLARFDGAPDLPDQWQPTGVAEYKLADGERVVVDKLGTMTIARSGIKPMRTAAARSA